MESHNRLRTLQQQLAQKGHWEAQLQALKDQQALLKRNVQALEKAKQSEQADVDRLEGRTLAAFFYNAIGKMEEKLTQERREAYAARAKYDAACRELADVEQDILRVQGELDHLATCRQEYDQAFQAKARALKASGSPAGLQVLQAEETLAQHASQIKELQEAISAGELAQGTIQELLSSLDSAESWGQWDVFGGGFLADMAKYDHLDDAQAQVERLQSQLRAFQRELADVKIQVDLQFTMDSFLRFADVFFDNIFTDWAVLDKISHARAQAQQTKGQIDSLLTGLQAQLAKAKADLRAAQRAHDTLVTDAPL